MTDLSHFRRFLPPVVAIALLACGARSTMEDEAATTRGTSGAAGSMYATGGAAGSMSTGGAGGAIYATGGAGGGFVGDCAYPSCVWGLIRDCLPVGPCAQSSSTDSSTVVCCSNGFNEDIPLSMQTSTHATGTIAISKNGKLCYDVEVDTWAGTMSGTYVLNNPAGATVAKGSLMSDGSIFVSCNDGETLTLPMDCPLDGHGNLTTEPGTCP